MMLDFAKVGHPECKTSVLSSLSDRCHRCSNSCSQRTDTLDVELPLPASPLPRREPILVQLMPPAKQLGLRKVVVMLPEVVTSGLA